MRKALDQPMPWVARREAAAAKAEGRPPPVPTFRGCGPGQGRRADGDAPAPASAQEEAIGASQMSARERMRELLELVVDALDLDADVVVEDDGETLTGVVEGDVARPVHRSSRSDDRRGAAPRDTCGHAAMGTRTRRRVVVDADGYRERRREALEHQADDAADEAVRAGRAVALDPMSPAERRIVHEYLRERDDVATESEGEGAERRLVVSPVD